MMLLPIRRETIVSSLSRKEILTKLKLITSPPARSKKDIGQRALFIGSIHNNTFRISIKINAPENFIPIIYGTIDKTSIGCIIYLKFTLFFSSIMFLAFWSVVCLLIATLFLVALHKNNLAFLALFAGLINYMVTMFFFQRKVRESYDLLMGQLKIS